jgi:hypothetical protein
MKTDDLIDMLARGAGPAPSALAFRRLAPAAGVGVGLSGVLAVLLLGAIPAAMYATPAPWFKLLYTGALAGSAGWLTARFSKPGASARLPAALLLGVALLMLAFGAMTLTTLPSHERLSALLGHSWLSCPWNVLALSLPAFAGAVWALRGLAPTRLRLAGFAAGVFAGSLGAFGYSFACPEASAAFVAVWYSIGILLSGLLGAVMGPKLLDW